MNIVIAGVGKVGEVLCRDLAKEGLNIMIIELNESRLDQLLNMYDINGVSGNGAMYDIQIEARVDSCDVFIATTSNDETNIIAAITAKKLGAEYTIARVRNPEYSKHMDFLRESLGITLMINPEMEAANEITRMLTFPAALNVESFENDRLKMIEIVLQSDAPMIGLKLKEYNGRFGSVLICSIVRDNQVIIPDGETYLKCGDHVMVTGSTNDVRLFCKYSQHNLVRISSVLIVGGGKLTNYLLSKLTKSNMRIKVIERSEDISDKLAAEFPKAEIICGDGTRQYFLNEERITDYDAVIALTGVDEENILVSIYASRKGVKKTITKINRTDLLTVLDNVGLQSIITPQRLIADQIIRFIRSTQNSQGSNIDAFYRMADSRVEVLQFKIKESSRVIRIPLNDLNTKIGVLIACIIRDDKLIYPDGSSIIQPDDNVIIVTSHNKFQNIDDILDDTRGNI